MGLDMYLGRRFYVKNWDHFKPEDRWEINIKKGGKKFPGITSENVWHIETQEVYWRKANAIHKWFVDNCQNGNDDCRKADVSTEHLERLLKTVNEVLEASEVDPNDPEELILDPRCAKRLLPTESGFFFGDTAYSRYYLEDLSFTKRELERILSQSNEYGHFYYWSSW